MHQQHYKMLEDMQTPPLDDILDQWMVRCHEMDDNKQDEDRELKLKRKASADDVKGLKKAKLDGIPLTRTETK